MEARGVRTSVRGSRWMAAAKWWVVMWWSCSNWVVGSVWAWECAATDRQTLLEFKSGFVDRDGVFSTWNVSTNCCLWSGVLCRESDGAVLEVALVGASGSGNQQSYRDASYNGDTTVGASLVWLTHLRKLTIQWVLLDGPIPSQWGEFSGNLKVLVINNANLRDDIPSSLASIPNLQTLNLKSNHLTGAIPAAFCDQHSLTYIDVSYNDMSYLLVPSCLQQNSSSTVTTVFDNQGSSSSPGSPANFNAATSTTFSNPFFVAFATLSSIFLTTVLN